MEELIEVMVKWELNIYSFFLRKKENIYAHTEVL